MSAAAEETLKQVRRILSKLRHPATQKLLLSGYHLTEIGVERPILFFYHAAQQKHLLLGTEYAVKDRKTATTLSGGGTPFIRICEARDTVANLIRMLRDGAPAIKAGKRRLYPGVEINLMILGETGRVQKLKLRFKAATAARNRLLRSKQNGKSNRR